MRDGGLDRVIGADRVDIDYGLESVGTEARDGRHEVACRAGAGKSNVSERKQGIVREQGLHDIVDRSKFLHTVICCCLQGVELRMKVNKIVHSPNTASCSCSTLYETHIPDIDAANTNDSGAVADLGNLLRRGLNLLGVAPNNASIGPEMHESTGLRASYRSSTTRDEHYSVGCGHVEC